MLELNKLYNMDCMQGMKEFPDGFFDLAIVDWERTQEETGKYECTAEKTDKIAFQCFVCGKINVFPATHADGNTCKYCGGGLKAIGYAKKTEGSRNAEK